MTTAIVSELQGCHPLYRYCLLYQNLHFPQHIDRRDIGIHSSESGALDFAFIEVKKPRAQVLPGRILHANKPFTDNQYRFNKTAAESIQKALK